MVPAAASPSRGILRRAVARPGIIGGRGTHTSVTYPMNR